MSYLYGHHFFLNPLFFALPSLSLLVIFLIFYFCLLFFSFSSDLLPFSLLLLISLSLLGFDPFWSSFFTTFSSFFFFVPFLWDLASLFSFFISFFLLFSFFWLLFWVFYFDSFFFPSFFVDFSFSFFLSLFFFFYLLFDSFFSFSCLLT